MKLAVRMLLAGTMLAGVALAGALWTTNDTSEANVVAGEYSIETNIASATSALNVTFQVVAAVTHGAGAQDCSGGAGQYGCYQAVQWFIEYDENVVDLGASGTPGTAANAITKVAAAPSACISKADNNDRVLLGCLDLGGPNMNYSGNVWNMNFFCIANSASTTFETFGLNTNSYVRVGAVNQPAHVHSDSIECTGGGAPTTPTPSPTTGAGATNTPPPGATNTPVPTNTSTGGGGATSTATTRIRTATPTNTVVSDETPGVVVETPVPGGTEGPPPPPGATATRPGGGAGGGNIRPPDTGDGTGSGGSDMMWLWMALGAAGLVTAAGGAGLLGLQKRKGN